MRKNKIESREKEGEGVVGWQKWQKALFGPKVKGHQYESAPNIAILSLFGHLFGGAQYPINQKKVCGTALWIKNGNSEFATRNMQLFHTEELIELMKKFHPSTFTIEIGNPKAEGNVWSKRERIHMQTLFQALLHTRLHNWDSSGPPPPPLPTIKPNYIKREMIKWFGKRGGGCLFRKIYCYLIGEKRLVSSDTFESKSDYSILPLKSSDSYSINNSV